MDKEGASSIIDYGRLVAQTINPPRNIVFVAPVREDTDIRDVCGFVFDFLCENDVTIAMVVGIIIPSPSETADSTETAIPETVFDKSPFAVHGVMFAVNSGGPTSVVVPGWEVTGADVAPMKTAYFVPSDVVSPVPMWGPPVGTGAVNAVVGTDDTSVHFIVVGTVGATAVVCPDGTDV